MHTFVPYHLRMMRFIRDTVIDGPKENSTYYYSSLICHPELVGGLSGPTLPLEVQILGGY